VLVVDDNVDIADGLAVVIASWHHVVQTAHDGQGAIAAAAAFNPDLALVDLGLPDMGGQDVARSLRGAPAHVHLRLVSMSGFDPQRAKRYLGEGGFHHHLPKPIDLPALRAFLESHEASSGISESRQ
jgi:DNA-binding response OmpR family regulator